MSTKISNNFLFGLVVFFCVCSKIHFPIFVVIKSYPKIQRVGHGWPGEIRRPPRRVLHPGAVRHHHVRRDEPRDLQERPQLAQGPRQGLREHTHCPHRQQGRHKRQESWSIYSGYSPIPFYCLGWIGEGIEKYKKKT